MKPSEPHSRYAMLDKIGDDDLMELVKQVSASEEPDLHQRLVQSGAIAPSDIEQLERMTGMMWYEGVGHGLSVSVRLMSPQPSLAEIFDA